MISVVTSILKCRAAINFHILYFWPTFVHEGIFSAVVSLHFYLEPKYFWSGQSGAFRYLARVCAGSLLEYCLMIWCITHGLLPRHLGTVPPLYGELGAQLGDRGVVGSKLIHKIFKSPQLYFLFPAESGRVEILYSFFKGWCELFDGLITVERKKNYKKKILELFL